MYGENTSSRFPKYEGKLIAGLAHEINNPLQSLLSLLYLLEAEHAVSAHARQLLQQAQDEAHRISLIAQAAMNDLRESTGRPKSSLPDLLHSVLDMYKSRFESRGIWIKADCCRDGHLAIEDVELRQILSNLLLNAADAMPNGGKIQVRVACAHEWAGQQRHGMRLTVGDNGIGIPDKDLSRILQPFFTTKGTAGTGIGLSLVSAAVKKYGGALRVRSCTREGRSGSVFSIFMPAA